ncbi:MAG TPA: NAD(P)-binding domain-containing protein, partial [Actinomycetota bacterium]|nr:NAD(P)-binding domain-containing protein [Actinomycetota bacterium]
MATRADGSRTAWRRELRARLRAKAARVGVVGLGYVGLPMLVSAIRVGFEGVGVDTDADRVASLLAHRSYVDDVPDPILRDLADDLAVSTDAAVLARCDVIVVCVPTPLRDHEPDLRFVELASEAVARHLRPGALVILESTTYPGTTDEIMRPILERGGLVAGRDFALAYSPERIDPGR